MCRTAQLRREPNSPTDLLSRIVLAVAAAAWTASAILWLDGWESAGGGCGVL